jgi:hypothetical protein
MQKSIAIWITSLFFGFSSIWGQQITYSEPDKDDSRTLNFEIVGKMNGNVLIYKNYRDLHFMSVYNDDMKMIEKNRLDFMPDKVIDVELVQYPDVVYLFYQYQKHNIQYAMVAKLNEHGKKQGDPILLDTTNINTVNNLKVYTFLASENKQQLLVYKIANKNDKLHILTTLLFNKELTLQHRSRILVPMPERNDFLTEFAVDNEGDLICIRGSGTAQNDNINKISLLSKAALTDMVIARDLKVSGIYLDDIRLKIDNVNKHYLVTSFYSKIRRGNVDGLYYSLWDKVQEKELATMNTIFTPEFRADAKTEGNTKEAFNDFFLKNIVLKKNGGFFIAAEAAYSSSRGNTLSRWDYLNGSPYYSSMYSPTDYYSNYSNLGYYPWSRSNSYLNNNTVTRYFADNVVLLSFDPNGKMEWSNVIRKAQFDDNTDNYIGYGVVASGDKAHFIFNIQDKRTMTMTDQSLYPDGQLDRNPTFKNLDRGYEFMPRYSKQIGLRQIIVPCQFRGSTCFVKVEFN